MTTGLSFLGRTVLAVGGRCFATLLKRSVRDRASRPACGWRERSPRCPSEARLVVLKPTGKTQGALLFLTLFIFNLCLRRTPKEKNLTSMTTFPVRERILFFMPKRERRKRWWII